MDCPSGPSEILENGTYGTLVTPGDIHGFTQALAHSLTNPSPAFRSIERARIFRSDIAAQAYIDTLGLSRQPHARNIN